MGKSAGAPQRQSGRLFILLVLLPLLCFTPWILMTGPYDLGRKFGIISDIKLQTFVKPGDLEALASKEPAQPKPGEPQAAAAQFDVLSTREAANRLSSVATTAMLVLVAAGAGLFGWMTAWRRSANPGDRPLFWLAPLMSVALLKAIWPGDDHRIYNLLGNGFFESTVGKIHGRTSLDVLDCQQIVSNFVLVVAGVGLTFGAAFIAIQASRLKSADDGPRYLDLKRQLDLILLGSALMLAAGVLDVKQWTALPLPFISDDKLAAAYASLAGAFVAFQSICYVAALVVMFLPTALLLDTARTRIVRKEASVEPAGSPASSLPEGFVATDLLRAAAMLAPILVGPVANFASLKIGI
ncbi:MAG TPA: hypothetical protein VF949_22025 [Reyranella sp.]